jgi:hypothetical protein
MLVAQSAAEKEHPIMSQVVSKDSLNALAAQAFASIMFEDPADPRSPEGNMMDAPLPTVFRKACRLDLQSLAAIVTHGLDSGSVRETIKAELRSPDRWWPELTF